MQINTLTSALAGMRNGISDTSAQRIQKAAEGSSTPFGALLAGNSAAETTSDGSRHWANVSMNLGAADGAVHVEDMVIVADLAMKDAQSQLDAAFAAAGISRSPETKLSLDTQGRIVVGEHPQKEKIEALLAGNAALTDNVREAMILKEQAVQTKRHADFAVAYQSTYASSGQAAATALWERFMAMSDPKAEFRYGNSGFQALFNGQSDTDYLAASAKALGIHPGFALDGWA